MAVYPEALWRPLSESRTQPRITPRLIILHSAVDTPGSTDLRRFFDLAGVKIESHFWVRLDGRVEQFIDTTVRADANHRANPFAISIETEDEGQPDRLPWTAAQLASLSRLVAWASRAHGIPLRRVDRWDGSGVDGHYRFPEWSIYAGKTCPGVARQPQIDTVIATARLLLDDGEEGEEMSAEQVDQILAQLRGLARKIDDATAQLDRLERTLDAVRLAEDPPAERKTRVSVWRWLASLGRDLGLDPAKWDPQRKV